jgi:hypothetical protein
MSKKFTSNLLHIPHFDWLRTMFPSLNLHTVPTSYHVTPLYGLQIPIPPSKWTCWKKSWSRRQVCCLQLTMACPLARSWTEKPPEQVRRSVEELLKKRLMSWLMHYFRCAKWLEAYASCAVQPPAPIWQQKHQIHHKSACEKIHTMHINYTMQRIEWKGHFCGSTRSWYVVHESWRADFFDLHNCD